MSESTAGDGDTLLEFPCSFTVKAFGKQSDTFAEHVRSLVATQVPDLADDAVRLRDSRSAKYVAVSVDFTATSKAQLDAIYQAFTADPQVVMAL